MAGHLEVTTLGNQCLLNVVFEVDFFVHCSLPVDIRYPASLNYSASGLGLPGRRYSLGGVIGAFRF